MFLGSRGLIGRIFVVEGLVSSISLTESSAASAIS